MRTLARELPPGLVNDGQQKTLFRAVSDRLGIPYVGAYTLEELRSALFHHVQGTLTPTEAFRTYGMCKAAFYRNLAKVDQTLRGDALRSKDLPALRRSLREYQTAVHLCRRSQITLGAQCAGVSRDADGVPVRPAQRQLHTGSAQ